MPEKYKLSMLQIKADLYLADAAIKEAETDGIIFSRQRKN